MAAVQGFLMYSINAISVGTTVSVRYRACVHNSQVSVRRHCICMFPCVCVYVYINNLFPGESLLLNPDPSYSSSSTTPMVDACSLKALFMELDGPMFTYQPLLDDTTLTAVSACALICLHCIYSNTSRAT